jgi:hypothetical protein
MRITKKKIAGVVAATTVIALGAGAAQAYFTSTGTGSDTATVGTSSDFTIVFGDLQGDPLLPGGPAQTRSYEVQYAGPGSAYLSSAVATVVDNGAADDAEVIDANTGVAAPGCLAEWFHAVPNGEPAGPVTPGDPNQGIVTITMDDAPVNQDACKNVSLRINLAAN